MSKSFVSHRFGPISTGQRQWTAVHECNWVHGLGRIVEITFSVTKPRADGVYVDAKDVLETEKWLRSEWDHRILLQHDDPLIDQFKTLHLLGGININVTPEGYGPGLEQSCRYVYDMIKGRMESATIGRVSVENVRIWEHENHSATYGTFPSK